MKMTKLAMLVLTIAVALFILIPNLSWAQDGAGLYKTKCAACHGADGAGKPTAKIPSLTADESKKMSDADLTDFIANGGPSKKATHAFATKGLEAVKKLFLSQGSSHEIYPLAAGRWWSDAGGFKWVRVLN